MHKETKPSSTTSSSSSSSRLHLARTAPDESIRSRHLTDRRDHHLFGGGGLPSGMSEHANRQTSPDELYEIASVFKPVPGYERPWEMAPPRYWGQLRRLFLEESMKSSQHGRDPSGHISGSSANSDHSSTSSSNLTSSKNNKSSELDSTSGVSGSSSGSLGSFSLSRASSSVHACGSSTGVPSDGPMSPLWEVGPPKHWSCLSNLKRDHNHHHQVSNLHNNHQDQSSLARDRQT